MVRGAEVHHHHASFQLGEHRRRDVDPLHRGVGVAVDADEVDPAVGGGELVLDPALLAELLGLDPPRGPGDLVEV